MLFNLATFIVGALALGASASPLKRQTGGSVTCDLVLQPQSAVSPTANLLAEFNFVIGRSLSIDAGDDTVDIGNSIFSENADGTFDVENTVSADGLTSAQTAAIITGWVGEVKQGSTINWLVESASC